VDDKQPYLCDRCREEREKQYFAAPTRWFLMDDANTTYVWRPSELFVEVIYV